MKNLLVRFRSFCVSSFPLVAFALVVSNFIVSCSISRSVKPQHFYHTAVVTNYIHSVVTNLSASVLSSPSFTSNSLSSSSSPSNDLPSYDTRYKYFVLESRRMVYMDGSYFREGDFCSRGLIVRIFPDRIYLHDGSVLVNRYQIPLDDRPVYTSPSVSETSHWRKCHDR